MRQAGRKGEGEEGGKGARPSPPILHEEEGPPFGGSWRALYAAVLGWLAAQVLLFYLFTRAFG